MAIKGKGLLQAKTYLEQVLDHQRCIPFRRFCGGVGRTAQAKAEGSTNGQGRWPKKSVDAILGLLQNMESNAELKGLQPEALFIQHVQVNQAPKQRRRTYRAHGRMGPYKSCPCHVEIIACEKADAVQKGAEGPGPKLTKRQLGRTA